MSNTEVAPFCTGCGSALKAEAAFCTTCGQSRTLPHVSEPEPQVAALAPQVFAPEPQPQVFTPEPPLTSFPPRPAQPVASAPTPAPRTNPMVSMGTRGLISLFYFGGAAVVFAICSGVQAAGHSDMFSTRYQDPGNFVLDLLMNVTFYPGWAATVALVLYGIASLIKTDD